MIGVLGLSHKTSTVEVRGKFSFTPDESVVFMKHLLETENLSGIVLLSTCNRTEIYFHSPLAEIKLVSQIEKELFTYKKVPEELGKEAFYYLTDEDCYLHLFNLTSGFDSMILGEYQILGQVKDAFRLSVENDCSCSVISRLFHKAFEIGKKVRNLYNITPVPISAGSVSVDFVASQLRDMADVRVFIIGAGQMAESVILGLRKYHVANISIYNRTIERAYKLASRYQVRVLQENKFLEGIQKSNLIFAATSALAPVITASMVSARTHDPAILFDLAVPRNIEEAVGSVAGNTLLSIDSLKDNPAFSSSNDQNILLAQELIQQSVTDFCNWLLTLNLSPTIDMLQESFDEVLHQRLRFLKNKVSEREYELISQTGVFLKDKYLRNIIASLKGLSENGAKPDYIEMINLMLGHKSAGKV
jgi:glutamyl-tRNA reductase